MAGRSHRSKPILYWITLAVTIGALLFAVAAQASEPEMRFAGQIEGDVS